MNTADVLIIGSGVIGASIAWHLSKKGFKKIFVVDKEPLPGLGSTGKATGGFRAQFATAVNIQLSLLSREKLLNFNDEIGIDPGFKPAGYLFIASNQKEMYALIALQHIQKTNGLNEVHIVSSDDISKLNSNLVIYNKLYGGAFSHSDGFIKPLNILNGYKSAAEKSGVEFIFDIGCTGFRLSPDKTKIMEAITSIGKISADYFVNAAGAWAAEIAKLLKINLPVVPQRRQIALLKEKNLFSEDMPMTIFINDGFHFRQRDGNVLLLYPEINETEPYDINVDYEWIEKVKSVADERIKNFQTTSIDIINSWAGLYELTPDKHAIIDHHPEISNLFFANGSSGHGVMHSPAIGEIISQLITDGFFKDFDITPLRFTRFDEKDLNPSSEYL